MPFKGRTHLASSAQHGLLRMLSYILQALSSDRAFGPALNEPLRINIPTKWIVAGNTSDFLIVVSVVVNSTCAISLPLSIVHILDCHHTRTQSTLSRIDNHTQ
jgi:hypothetical protein